MNHTDNHFFLNLYQSNFSNNSKSTTILKRQDLFHSINGDALYPLNSWPSNIKRIITMITMMSSNVFHVPHVVEGSKVCENQFDWRSQYFRCNFSSQSEARRRRLQVITSRHNVPGSLLSTGNRQRRFRVHRWWWSKSTITPFPHGKASVSRYLYSSLIL